MGKEITLKDIRRTCDKLEAKVNDEKLDMDERVHALVLLDSLEFMVHVNNMLPPSKRRLK